jgi:tight adherence protein B
MVFVVVTFGLVVSLVLGIYWVMVERPETLEQSQLKKRLRAGGASARAAAARVDFVRQAEKLSALKPLDKVLAHTQGLSSWLQRLIEQADVPITVGGLMLASLCLFLFVWVFIGQITRLSWLGFAFGLLFACLPYFIVRYKATKRLRMFEEQFPEAIELIGRALKAGHAFTTGLAIVAEEAPQPVAGEFRLLYDQQNFGMPLTEALKAFAQRVPLLDSRFFVTAVLTQRESGGNLAEILSNLAGVIRERFKVKRQVRVISAHGRLTGWVLSGLPPALACAFLITSPNHIMTLVNDEMGIKMIFAALFLQILGTVIIRRLVNIEY